MSLKGNRGFVHTVDDYEIIEITGEGTYGEVYKAKQKATQEVVAMKKMRFTSIGLSKSCVREIKIYNTLQHPNIAQIKEIVVDNVQPGVMRLSNHFYIVMEYVDNDLAGIQKAILKGYLPVLSLSIIKAYVFQIVHVLDFLHTNGIIHRDLKLDNILITNDHRVKLCDFGLSRALHKSRESYSLPVYALAYRSPEILLHSPLYDASADIWALGIILSTLLLGVPIFSGSTDNDILNDILSKSGVVPAIMKGAMEENSIDVSTPSYRCIREILEEGKCIQFAHSKDKEDYIDLVDRCLDLNPLQRPTSTILLQHPFLENCSSPDQFKSIDQMKSCSMSLSAMNFHG